MWSADGVQVLTGTLEVDVVDAVDEVDDVGSEVVVGVGEGAELDVVVPVLTTLEGPFEQAASASAAARVPIVTVRTRATPRAAGEGESAKAVMLPGTAPTLRVLEEVGEGVE
jgi:hypothetical protein